MTQACLVPGYKTTHSSPYATTSSKGSRTAKKDPRDKNSRWQHHVRIASLSCKIGQRKQPNSVQGRLATPRATGLLMRHENVAEGGDAGQFGCGGHS